MASVCNQEVISCQERQEGVPHKQRNRQANIGEHKGKKRAMVSNMTQLTRKWYMYDVVSNKLYLQEQ